MCGDLLLLDPHYRLSITVTFALIISVTTTMDILSRAGEMSSKQKQDKKRNFEKKKEKKKRLSKDVTIAMDHKKE